MNTGFHASQTRRVVPSLLIGGLLLISQGLFAAVVLVWNGGTGNWNNAANWTPNTVPNNGGGNTYDVRIDDGNAAVSQVTLDASATVENITIDADDSLSVLSSRSLTVTNSIANAGSVNLNASTSSNASLIASGNVTLNGGGTVNLTDGTFYNYNRIYGDAGTSELTNVDNLIQGAGNIGFNSLVLDNQGTIAATTSHSLTLDTTGTAANATATLTNSGTIKAVSGGLLTLANSHIRNTGTIVSEAASPDAAQITLDTVKIDNTGGVMRAEAGSAVTVTSYSSSTNTIIGGQLTGAGSFNVSRDLILDGSGSEAVTQASTLTVNGYYTTLLGTITNTGTLAVNANGSSYIGFEASGSVTLNGGGTVNLTDGIYHNYNTITGDSGTAELVNVNNTIQGAGRVGNNFLVLDNQGTIAATTSHSLTLDTTGTATNATATLTNSGTIKAASGGLLTLANSHIRNTGTIVSEAASPDAAQVVLDTVKIDNTSGVMRAEAGSTVTVTSYSSSTNTIIGGQLTGAGSFNVSRDLILDGSGSEAVTQASTLTVNGYYTTLLGTITNTGTLAVNANGSNYIGFEASGSVTLNGGGTVNLTDSIYYSYNTIRGDTGTAELINVNNTIQGAGRIGFNSLIFTNRGTVTANEAHSLTVDPTGTSTATEAGVINSGLMQAASGGTLALTNGRYDNFEGVTNGTIRATEGSTVQITSSTVNGGRVESTGTGAITISTSTLSGSDVEIVDGGQIQMSGASGIVDGTLKVGSSGTLNITTNSSPHARIGGTFTNDGVVNVTGSYYLDIESGTSFTNNGAFNMTANYLQLNGDTTLGGTGTLTMNYSANQRIMGSASTNVLTNAAGHTIQGWGYAAYNIGLVNEGTIEGIYTSSMNIYASSTGAVNAATGVIRGSSNGGIYFFSGPFTNNGTVEAVGGNVSSSSTAVITNYNSTTQTLTGGTWRAIGGATAATLNLYNATIQTNAANVELSGSNSTFAAINSINNNEGSFTLRDGRNFTTNGALTNSGDVTVADSTTTFTVNGAYTQTGGSTTLTGSSTIAVASMDMQGGELRGNGTLTGPLTASGGAIRPGESPGTLNIIGSTILGAGNTLGIELGGLNPGLEYDVLSITGTLDLAGLLELNFINGFESLAMVGDLFTIGTASSGITGAFSNVASGGTLSDISSFGIFNVYYGAGSAYGADNIVLQLQSVVPEPGRALLLLFGAGVLFMRRKRTPNAAACPC